MHPTSNRPFAATVQAATRMAGFIAVLAILWPAQSMALPIFNRQTGQNCVACHAGGQFP